MARRVFFSFDYQDVADFRVNVVRNHWMTKPDRESAGFFDASVWEAARRTGPIAIKRLVNTALQGTSATCVLVGTRTFERPWVRFEVISSFLRGNKILAVHINSIPDKFNATAPRGPNPLASLGVTYSDDGGTGTLWEIVGKNWVKYAEIDGRSTYRTGPVSQQYRGKGFSFSNWYGEYDWMKDEGYVNFAKWIE